MSSSPANTPLSPAPLTSLRPHLTRGSSAHGSGDRPDALTVARRQLPRAVRNIGAVEFSSERARTGGCRDWQCPVSCCYDHSVLNAPLAQLAEQRTLNPRVRGSSPWRRTRSGLGLYPFRAAPRWPFLGYVGSMCAREFTLVVWGLSRLGATLSTARACSPGRSARRGCAGIPNPGCPAPFPAPAHVSPSRSWAVQAPGADGSTAGGPGWRASAARPQPRSRPGCRPTAAHLDRARDDILAFTAFPARSGSRSGPTIPRSG